MPSTWQGVGEAGEGYARARETCAQQNATVGRFSDLSEPHVCHFYTRDNNMTPGLLGGSHEIMLGGLAQS